MCSNYFFNSIKFHGSPYLEFRFYELSTFYINKICDFFCIYLIVVKLHRGFVLVGFDAADIVGLF